jgi:hypothetical protein
VKKVAQNKDETPLGLMTPEEASAKAATLVSVIYESIQPVDIKHITTTLVGRAKNGEHRAMMTVFNLIGAGTPGLPAPADEPRLVGNMVQVNVGENSRDRVTVNAVGGDGMKVAQLLLNRGPLAPRIVAAECDIPTEKVEELIQTGWFEKTKKGALQLTPVGREEIEEADEG